MRGRAGELTADWLMLIGGSALLASLFLTWSHQFPSSLRSVPGLDVALGGVPRNPTAWEVYSIADVLLAALAAVIVGAALRGGPRARAVVLALCAIALAFTVHAISVPPTNGVNIVNPAAPARGYIGGSYASSGVGETVALAALSMALLGAGLGLRFRPS